jgi:multidrug efflux pump
MIGVTLFSLFLTPVFYVVLEKLGLRKPVLVVPEPSPAAVYSS